MKKKPATRQIRLAISSNAGGSGKSTMAVHLAYAVAKRGYKTTLIELDHNGSLCVLAGLPPAEDWGNSLATVFKKDFCGDYPLVPLWKERLTCATAIRGGEPLAASIAEIYKIHLGSIQVPAS